MQHTLGNSAKPREARRNIEISWNWNDAVAAKSLPLRDVPCKPEKTIALARALCGSQADVAAAHDQ
jgi:hypothetical protein